MIELKKNLTLDDVWVGKKVSKHVSQFGLLVGIICLLIGGLKLWFGWKTTVSSIWIVAGLTLIILGKIAPNILKPVWYYWMKGALFLGLFVTSIIVFLAWIILFVPMGILFKIIGKKTVQVDLDRSAATYWEKRDKKYSDFKLLERQF